MGCNLGDLEKMVAELSPIEKVTLVQRLLTDLNVPFPGIDADPAICGGDPCIARTRIPVWLLVQFRQSGMSESDLLKNYPSLSASDLTNAWAYYALNKAAIDAQIRQNEEAE